MIRVVTEGPTSRAYEDWYAEAVTERSKVIDFWKNQRKSSNSPGVWSAVRKVEVRGVKPQEIWNGLKIIFLHSVFRMKCAYCEGKYGAGHAWHVEHYRPKSEVTERRSVIEHPGYFWLTHEWYNLLLSCGHCNTWEEKTAKTGGKSDPSKSNEFRVLGRRVTQPGPDPSHWLEELNEEQPLLLNPYFDDPGEHLAFTEEGQIYGTTERGKETVAVCNLWRPSLVEDRLRSTATVFKAVVEQLSQAEKGKPPPDRYFGPEDEFSAWKNFWATVLIRRIMPGSEPPSNFPALPERAPNHADSQEWPTGVQGQAQAALAALAGHPEGLTPAQLAKCYRRTQYVRIVELLDLLESVGKVRTNVAGRFFCT